VVELVYASLSAATDAAQLGQAVLASRVFVAASGVLGVVLPRKLAAGVAAALCASMRDFALATPAVGASTGTVAGVYGVLVLVLGAAAS
jgi:hypothetical protein